MQAPSEQPRTATILELDPDAAVRAITAAMQRQVGDTLRRRGVVVAMSGGVDSSVCAALAVRTFGPQRVFGVMMPDRDSEPESAALATDLAARLGIEHVVQDITDVLDTVGCYARRDEAVQRVVPEYGPGWRSKIVLPGNRLDSDQLSVSSLVVEAPDGSRATHRLPADVYRQIVAATNFKQRVRKMFEYYHADRLHFAVLGTANRLEYDQGFFVKGGDGLADLKPIAHLYKTQVYQLAEWLGVPHSITGRSPTTDTYSLPQTQEEFYFSLPVVTMDLVLHAYTSGRDAQAASELLGLEPEQVGRAYRDIERKRRTTAYLHAPPLLVEPVALGAAEPELR